jgi:hypothetical protein
MTTPLDRAEKVMEHFRLLSYEMDGYGTPVASPRNNEELLIDIICDLYHWAWEVDEDFENCVAVAIKNGRTTRQINAFSKGDIL